jgi:hypothetical protein
VALTTVVLPVAGVAHVENPQTDSTVDGGQFESQTSGPLSTDKPEQGSGLGLSLPLGVVFLLLGAVQVYFAEPLAEFGEQYDAVGSNTPPEEVEAADWNIMLAQVLGVLFVLFGISIIVRSVL